jgi:class 3 adenylate cyclase
MPSNGATRRKAASLRRLMAMKPKMVLSRGILLAGLVVLLLAALPVAVWLDLRELTESLLRRQATDLNSAISSIRGYYANHVVRRVLASQGAVPGATQVLPNYEEVPGAIPIPATLSLELARVIGERQANIAYRFVSDYPFRNRAAHALDAFEVRALAALRADPKQELTKSESSLMTDRVRHIMPIVMEAPCVACHNAHPDSPKRDWKVGDVRGIQEVTVTQSIAANLLSLRHLLTYLGLATAAGFAFIFLQGRQAAAVASINCELEKRTRFLAAISTKISRYFSPQIYESIFNGESDAAIQTQRKKLTIFFSDIQDFTGLTLSMQPEEIAALLNDYLTEMSAIALASGGTVDKFIGDAILVFFGDPQSWGAQKDAQACLGMAADMQRRIAELNIKWRKAGIERPLRVRMGINTGFCNVGNFGSANRMDYTVIGAEVNLAARLQSIAEPGGIVMSYETYALVRDRVVAGPLSPLPAATVGREVVPYAVEHWLDADGRERRTYCGHMPGLDLYVDSSRLDPAAAARARSLLESALAGLDNCASREGEHRG